MESEIKIYGHNKDYIQLMLLGFSICLSLYLYDVDWNSNTGISLVSDCNS